MAIFQREPRNGSVECSGVMNKKLTCRRETARCFVSLNISLSHSRSLNVIRNDTIKQGVCKSLLMFHFNYVCISLPFQRQIMAWSWHLSYGSFKVIENGAICKTTDDLLLVIDSSILYHFRDIWRRIKSWRWNLC